MSIFRHVWFAVRHGDWSMGWDRFWGDQQGEPFICLQRMYYSGDHCYLRVGHFWFGVTY